jgi:hypothetical protein
VELYWDATSDISLFYILSDGWQSSIHLSYSFESKYNFSIVIR